MLQHDCLVSKDVILAKCLNTVCLCGVINSLKFFCNRLFAVINHSALSIALELGKRLTMLLEFLLLERNVHAAVHWVTEREGGGLL